MLNWLDILLGNNNLTNVDGSIVVDGNAIKVGVLALLSQHGYLPSAVGENFAHELATEFLPGFQSAADKAGVPRFLHANYSVAASNAAVPTDPCGFSVYRGATTGVRRPSASLMWLEAFSTWAFALNTGGDDVTIGALQNLNVAGLTASSDCEFNTHRLKGVATPTDPADATPKSYVDAAIAGVSGGGAIVRVLKYTMGGTDYSEGTTTYSDIISGAITSTTGKIRVRAWLKCYATAGNCTLRLYCSSESTMVAICPVPTIAADRSGSMVVMFEGDITITPGFSRTFKLQGKSKDGTAVLHSLAVTDGEEYSGGTMYIEELA